jgi:hypothetical protein
VFKKQKIVFNYLPSMGQMTTFHRSILIISKNVYSKMKNLIPFVALLLLAIPAAFAQPTIQWQRSLGGAQVDNTRAIARFGTGYVVAGTTFSPTIPNFHGSGASDVYVARLNAAGQVISQRAIGGMKTMKPTTSKPSAMYPMPTSPLAALYR